MSRGPWGSLNLGLGHGDAAGDVAANRRRVAAALGFDRLWLARQVHGTTVADVDGDAAPAEADVLLLRRPGVLGGVLGADCPLALLVDPHRETLALVHAGWRGTVARALPAAIRALAARGGSSPGELLLGLGPAIGASRYEVDADVADAVAGSASDAEHAVRRGSGGKAHVDLRRVLQLQALDAGVAADRIETAGGCTYEDPTRFYSHRRDGPQTGRHALVAGWVG